MNNKINYISKIFVNKLIILIYKKHYLFKFFYVLL